MTITQTCGLAVAGYASLFGVRDLNDDVVEPGTFARSLARGRARVRCLYQHDPGAPIGVWDRIEEDARGLRVAGRLRSSTPQGAAVAALVRAGAVDGLSIGFRTVRATRTPDGVRRLIEIDLWEISIVVFPMLPGARLAIDS
ncbi:MAG: HK97 family phage prohead protease [Maricaulaceae bacterium]